MVVVVYVTVVVDRLRTVVVFFVTTGVQVLVPMLVTYTMSVGVRVEVVVMYA